MPPKNEKIENNEAPKKKNFFDLDEDDTEEVAENQNPAPKKNEPTKVINKDRLKELGANMRDLFHEDKEDDLFEEKEEEVQAPLEQKKEERPRVVRKNEMRTEHPHLFYDGGIDLNDKMQGTVGHDDTKPSIPNFYKQLDDRIKDKELAEKVRSELSEIIKASGIKDQSKVGELAEFTQSYVAKTMIDAPIPDKENPKMSNVAPEFFSDAYFAISEAGLTPTSQIITAQKIADVMLKNYSPAAILKEELAEYTNNYVVKNSELLKARLEMQEYPPENIDEVIEDVQAEISGKPKPERKVEEKQPAKEPAQITKKRSIFGDDYDEQEEEEDTLAYSNNLDFLKGSVKPQTNMTHEDMLAKLRTDVLTNKATRITKEELRNSNGIVTVEDVFGAEATAEKVNETPTPSNENKENTSNEKKENTPNEKKENTPNEPAASEKVTPPAEKEPKKINDSANVAVFLNQLNAFNKMYKLNIQADEFAFSVTESWTMMKSGDKQKNADGKKMMNDLFKDTLKKAFDIEKDVAYDEHRLPDYNEIIKSSNELLRVSMFAFTDLYHDPKSASLFEPTAFGGMSSKDMAQLASGESVWSMDQKSDLAWDIQSKEAKNIADKWLGDRKPYEKMINEMSALVEANKNSILDRKEILNKLAAAEWMLLNNEKMMVDNPEDPINPIPNWGNRYWKALTSAREALGIDKHISMRELIQGEYAASAKAANNTAYTETQINDYVLDPGAREIYDSMDVQKEQFATQSAAVVLSEPPKENEKTAGEKTSEERDMDIKSTHERVMEELRVRISIKSEDQREIMKNEPKSYNFVTDKTAELQLDGVKNTPNM